VLSSVDELKLTPADALIVPFVSLGSVVATALSSSLV
jgi:hypothetical protein